MNIIEQSYKMKDKLEENHRIWDNFKVKREENSQEGDFGYFNVGGERVSIPKQKLDAFPNSEFS